MHDDYDARHHGPNPSLSPEVSRPVCAACAQQRTQRERVGRRHAAHISVALLEDASPRIDRGTPQAL